MEKLNFDFGCLPAWAKWIAMDENGNWYWYSGKPYTLSDCWFHGIDVFNDQIPEEYKPIFSGDWKDSLFQVPSKK